MHRGCAEARSPFYAPAVPAYSPTFLSHLLEPSYFDAPLLFRMFSVDVRQWCHSVDASGGTGIGLRAP